VSGLALGYAGITTVVAAGAGALVAQSPNALTGLTVIGGLYLIWHGAQTFASRDSQVVPSVGAHASAAAGPVESGWVKLAQGVGVSGLNPKGLLILLALLPQFTNPTWTWPVAAQICALGLVFIATCVAFYLILGSFARIILQAKPRAARAASRVSGAGMIIVGLALILDRFT